MSRRLFVLLVAAGLIAQIAMLVLSGTSDVRTLKTWALQAASAGPLAAYKRPAGTDDWLRPDYPPIAIVLLTASAKLARWIDPSVDRPSRLLTVLVKAPVLIARALFVVLLYWLVRRSSGRAETARWAALSIWLNPAFVLNGPALGYFDALCWSLGVVAVILSGSRLPVGAGVVAALATLIKPQGLFFLVAVVASATGSVRRVGRTIVGAVVTTVVIGAPFVLGSSWVSMFKGLRANFEEDMLSAHALNFWWLVTVAARVVRYGRDALNHTVLYLPLSRFVSESGLDVRAGVSLAIAISAIGIAWSVRRCADTARIAAAAALAIHIYFVFGISVHENHLIYAVAALGLVAMYERAYHALFVAASALATANMLLFYGFGRDFSQLDRVGWFLPITSIASLAVVGLLIAHVRAFLTIRRRTAPLSWQDASPGPG